MSSAKAEQSVFADFILRASGRMKRLWQKLDWLTIGLKRIHDTTRTSRDLAKQVSQFLDWLATWRNSTPGTA